MIKLCFFLIFSYNPSKDKNISQIQVLPGSKKHGNVPYVKISTSDIGKIKIIASNAKQYKTDGKVKSTILFREKNMININEKLVPFVGLGKIKLLSTLDEIKDLLKENKISFKEECQSNKGCNPEIPWIILHICNSITLSFAKNKLWEIYCEGDFAGLLPNGIKIGMPMKDALKIDTTLKYNDWNEDYESSLGYWIEDNLDDDTVMSITIFIKEVLDDNIFFRYEW